MDIKSEWNTTSDLNGDWRESTRLDRPENGMFEEEGASGDSNISTEIFIEHMNIQEPIVVLR